ncbi:hypothetical protein FRB91_004293 [Serendipita sp. 411]|nr:hypothetical protein FRB91_004293 [Serendipita sp. 411]
MIAYGDRVDFCEEGTRVEILDAIRNWATSSGSTRQIFWLNDAAGTGKSTIAATIANEWLIDNRLAGRFFFSPNSRTTQTTKEFCRFVANDIARNQPSLADTIQDEIKSISSEQHVWFDIQLQRLIINPVGKLEGDIFIVVDALDNCVLNEERVGLLNSFVRHLPSVLHLKLLLTSRPVQDIADVLTSSPLVHGSDLQLFNVRNSHHPDVILYVEKRLMSISLEDRAMIIARSGGLFLYAATVCRMLERSRHRTDILKIISDVGVTDKLEQRMDTLYLSVLKQALIDRDAGDMMMSVLSMIIAAYQPLSSNTISQFLPGNIYVEDFVQDLGGVLKDGHPDRPIKVLHPTFREFILSNVDRANGFLLHSAQSAAEMAYASLQTYCMALFFTPPESPLFGGYRKRYRDRQPDIITSSIVEWEDHVVLGGHSTAIDQLIFSPDGSRLISTDLKGRLQLWDTETGGLVGRPFDDTFHGGSFDIRCTFSLTGDRFGFITWTKEMPPPFCDGMSYMDGNPK